MRQRSVPGKAPAEQVVKDIRRATQWHFSVENKIRIVLGASGGRYRRGPVGHTRVPGNGVESQIVIKRTWAAEIRNVSLLENHTSFNQTAKRSSARSRRL